MNTEKTYGGFRLSFLHSDNKKDFWNDSLFLNLYNFWQLPRDGFLLKTYKKKEFIVEKNYSSKSEGGERSPHLQSFNASIYGWA